MTEAVFFKGSFWELYDVEEILIGAKLYSLKQRYGPVKLSLTSNGKSHCP